jgi:hypothetical protein
VPLHGIVHDERQPIASVACEEFPASEEAKWLNYA